MCSIEKLLLTCSKINHDPFSVRFKRMLGGDLQFFVKEWELIAAFNGFAVNVQVFPMFFP